MFFRENAERIGELARYYSVGVVNSAFGYGLYAGLIYIGLNLYVAQILAHICGMTFNYFMFRRHVFRSTTHSIWSYISTYAVNYLIGLIFLTISHSFIHSKYLAGFVSLLATAMLNYVLLKMFVFKRAG